jgi:amino acid transporter
VVSPLFRSMTRTLLLDPHWEYVGKNITLLLFVGFVLPLAAWLVLRASGQLENSEEAAKTAAWSTRRATVVVVTCVLLLLAISYFMH